MNRRVKFEAKDKNPQNIFTGNVEQNKKREVRNEGVRVVWCVKNKP